MSAKILIDADMPKSCKKVIENAGYEAIDVRNIGLGTAPDQKIIEYASSHDYVILTRDLDFGDIVRYPIKEHHGVMILRLPNTFTANEINTALQRFLKTIGEKEIIDSITIIELGRYRIRR